MWSLIHGSRAIIVQIGRALPVNGSGPHEIDNLAASADLCCVGHFRQLRSNPRSADFLGAGTIAQLAKEVESLEASLVVFDCELKQSQITNLEQHIRASLQFGGPVSTDRVRVVDRTQLILTIFARHAASGEGRLQAQIAQLKYYAHSFDDKGDIGRFQGTREATMWFKNQQRRSYRLIRILEARLEKVKQARERQRRRRYSGDLPTIVFVGYTNVGKSTLFNTLTRATVPVSGRMFETVDPTIRAIRLPSRRRALLIDTVGFIKNLPTSFVQGFSSTLEEITRASLIVHISDAKMSEQDQHVEEVLASLQVDAIPRIRVFSKIDQISAKALDALVAENGIDILSTAYVSAISRTGINDLLDRIDIKLDKDPLVRIHVSIPHGKAGLLAEIGSRARVFRVKHTPECSHYDLQVPRSFARKLDAFTSEPEL